MTFLPVLGRHKKRHTNLWLFYQFWDGIKNDIQTYDFFTFFRRHDRNVMLIFLFHDRNVMLIFLFHVCCCDLLIIYATTSFNCGKTINPTFLHFSDDMQTSDFFTFFRRHANLWLFIIGIIEPLLYKSCISFVDWLLMWHWNFMQTYDFFTFFRRHANLWLFYIFQTTCKPLTFLHFSDDMQTFDFFTFFRRHANLWLFYIFQTTCKPLTFLHFSDDMQTFDFFTFFRRHANLWLFIIGIIEPSLYKSCISFVDWLLIWHWHFN